MAGSHRLRLLQVDPGARKPDQCGQDEEPQRRRHDTYSESVDGTEEEAEGGRVHLDSSTFDFRSRYPLKVHAFKNTAGRIPWLKQRRLLQGSVNCCSTSGVEVRVAASPLG